MTRLWLVGSLFLMAVFLHGQERFQPQERFLPPDIFDTRLTALDPAHFHPVLENDHVQVIRVRLGPHEKFMVMEIPAHVMACLTDQHVRVLYAHGKPTERAQRAGYTGWMERDQYGLENLEDKPAEWILVVPKSG
jgi:hypothetical protein